jgi:Arc/MetJ-type ribon-helix-helix transcriptional regulator
VETEKVCVNLPAAELGKIDVLVAEGLYASRTDVIRSGIRTVLESHDDAVQRVVRSARIGYQLLLRSELEAASAAGSRLSLFVVGVLRIPAGVSPDLADATIEKIRIFGAVRAPDAVLRRLEDRIVRGVDHTVDGDD